MDKIILFSDRAIFISLCALVYFFPISIALVEFFSATALLFFLIKKSIELISKKNRTPSLSGFSKVTIALWLFVLVNFVSIFTSFYPKLSAMGFFGKTLQGVFVYLCVLEAIRTDKRLKILLDVFLISFLLVTLSGIFQHISGVDFILFKPLLHGRITSSFRSPPDFSAYLVMVAPVIFALAMLKKGEWRQFFPPLSEDKEKKLQWTVWGLFILALACLGFTFTRAAWLAAFAALLFVGFFKNKKYVVYCLVLGIIFISFFSVRMMSERKYMEWRLYFSGFGRIHQWKTAVNIIKTHPVKGVGLNGYSDYVRDHNMHPGGYPHNCYLQMASETGIPGVLAFGGVMVMVFGYGLRQLKQINSRVLNHLLLGLLGGLGGFLFHSFFDTFFYSTQLSAFMWIVVGLIMAIPLIDKTSPVPDKQIVDK